MANKVTEAQLKKLISLINQLEPERDYSDSYWKFYFPINSKEWEKLSITLYDSNYYFGFASSKFSFCYPGEKDRIDWEDQIFKKIIEHVPKIIAKIQKNMESYYRSLIKELPVKYRWGVMPRKALLLNIDDMYRPELELGAKNTKELVRWIEKNGREKGELSEPMTLELYLKYCKIAYNANAKKLHVKGTESGFELYKRLADNRHEGLLDIDPKSPKAFKKWFHGKHMGGHPWEIYRGGNTTHINLGITTLERYLVKDPKDDKFIIYLQGLSTSRLVETANIALAFIRNKMPFQFMGAEDVRLKLLALDNIGIIPSWYSLHRGNQNFIDGLNVNDCIHYEDLTGSERKKIFPYITWLPQKVNLPPLPITKKCTKKI